MARTAKTGDKPKGSRKKAAKERKPARRKASTTASKPKHKKQGKATAPKRKRKTIINKPVYDGRVRQLPPTQWEKIREGHRMFDSYNCQFRYYIGDRRVTKRQLMAHLKSRGIYNPGKSAPLGVWVKA